MCSYVCMHSVTCTTVCLFLYTGIGIAFKFFIMNTIYRKYPKVCILYGHDIACVYVHVCTYVYLCMCGHIHICEGVCVYVQIAMNTNYIYIMLTFYCLQSSCCFSYSVYCLWFNMSFVTHICYVYVYT